MNIYGFTRVRFDGVLVEFGDASEESELIVDGKHVRCWSIRRDCKRLRSEKKSSSGKVFDVGSFDELFDGDSVIADIGLVVNVLWLWIGISAARWSSRRES